MRRIPLVPVPGSTHQVQGERNRQMRGILREKLASLRKAKIWKDKLAVAGGVITVVLVMVALLAPVLAPHGYKAQNLAKALTPPVWYPGGDMNYLLGADHLGRDLLSRIIYGARISLAVGAGAVFLAGTLGTVIGVISGFFEGKVDAFLMRLADTQLSFPGIFLAIAIMAVLGQGATKVVIVLGLVSWVGYARVARGSTLAIKRKEFVQAAICLGARSPRIIIRHILPNVLPPIITIATINVSGMILAEAGLSFLGLGVQPPLPTWGRMLNDGRQYFSIAPWNALFPGLAIVLTVFAINLFGDGLAKAR